MDDQEVLYAKADPSYIDLDHEDGGSEFAKYVRSLIDENNSNRIAKIVLDLSGNVRLDYWGCSRLLDACIDIFTQSSNKGRKTLMVITSLRYENKEQYAWLFFNKSHFDEGSKQTGSFLDKAVTICGKYGFQFDLYKVPLRFAYEMSKGELVNPQVVLSSK